MKEVDELNFPDDMRFSKDHEWARAEGELFVIGITDYAQDQMGDVVYVELPAPGTRKKDGEEFGTVESVKAVSELFMPLGGEITAINKELEDRPEMLNSDPYLKGWMIKIKPDDPKAFDGLMDRSAYVALLKG